MQYTVIENTDVRVSRISFGTASLHHQFSAKQRQYLLESAASEGISHFDTSPYYGYGLAESDLGAFMRGRRDRFTVATKVGLYSVGGAAHGALGVWGRKALGKIAPRVSLPVVDWTVRRAARSLDASLRRLKSDYVDFVFLHEPDIGLLDREDFLMWLETEQSKGKIRYWGLAGLPALLEPWLRINHPLAGVLQVKDSLDKHEADFIMKSGRTLQFSYGYLSSMLSAGNVVTADAALSQALLRNSRGSILVSTRKVERIKTLARLSG